MGLIKAAIGSIGGTFADQWKEFFYCDALASDILVVKGQKRISGRSSNTKGNENIISNGSGIAVADGQCMIIVEQGKIVDLCAEPGEYTFDKSTEPSLFSGSLGRSIIDTFKTIGKRFTYGGDTGKDQRVYYVNTKEIANNKFGTATPVPFKVVINANLGFQLSVDLRLNGIYSYKIVDPILFYTNVCGNVRESYGRDEIDSMLKGELIMSLQPALAALSASGVSYDQIPAHSREVRDALNQELKNDWGKRGIEVFSMNMGIPSIPEDQRKKLTEWEETSMTLHPQVAASRMVGGQINAMNTAAGNANGAMNGFVGMGMAMNSAGTSAQNLYSMGQTQTVNQTVAASWKCACGASVTGNFCTECGKPRMSGWVCSCGTENKGKFCSNCGLKKPAGVPKYRCDKCGWEPSDPTKPPKFCPECGDRFDESDIIS